MKDIIIDCRNIASKDELLRHLYKKLGYDDYLEYVNLDGLIDLLEPDVNLETNIHIQLTHFKEMIRSIGHQEIDNIYGTFAIIENRWQRYKKSFSVDYV
jgi:RNAse (barnase) inhibitor barstar